MWALDNKGRINHAKKNVRLKGKENLRDDEGYCTIYGKVHMFENAEMPVRLCDRPKAYLE